MKRWRIGIAPAPVAATDGRLLDALSAAFPVDFATYQPGRAPEPDAVVVKAPGDLPGASSTLRRLPYLHYRCRPGAAAKPGQVVLAASEVLDAEFRGRRLSEEKLPAPLRLPFADGTQVLAAVDGAPVWTVSDAEGALAMETATTWPGLAPEETLRDLFRAGRFLSLLPLLTLLSHLGCRQVWQRPPLRASFLLDDPNLHAGRYGFFDYSRCEEAARRHGFHLAIATIPLDGWYVNEGVARIFRENSSPFSLLIHGNDHLREELGKPRSAAAFDSMLAQALRRVDRLEERIGLTVARVMAVPHGRCLEAAAMSLQRLGYEALCISRPYPWLARPPAEVPLADWFPAEIVAGGLPVIPRHPIARDRDDLVFRAWLGQPLVVYGHHDDLADGLEILGELTGFVEGLGPTTWCGIGRMARSNVWTRRDGDVLTIAPFSRRFEVMVPAGVRQLVVSTPFASATHAPHLLIRDGEPAGPWDPPVTLPVEAEGPRATTIELRPRGMPDHREVPAPPRRLWPICRRFLTELRDRTAPWRRF